ncbi:hypothetical protein [Vibrio coralliilyticus]|uniref:hypothetical protein n=1 Tax=Vibrio coralliilyticus TaxID=190893 RepID=UPI000B33655B|nr:hypothetical protein [Vibrio coralliilyticus]
MDAVFPITQRNGEPYHTLSDFTKLFDQVKSGRYLLGQGYGWHSGVHLTSKMVPWGKGLRPIQAMMDGKIVAYRIHADYQTTTYKDQELKYSNNFVLLEHEYKNPEKDDEVFKLYSLYMHLAPPSDIGANSSLTTRYKLVDDGWNVRTFKLGGAPERGKVESKVSMSSGTVLEYLHAEEQETVGFEIGGHTYKMIKCRVVQLGDSPSSSEKQMKGKIVWFAAGKESDFDILNDTSVMVPEPVSEPEWMSKNAASLRDGSVVTLGLPLPLNIDFGAIEVKAGDELGYMGLHEYSNDAHATKKEDNRVHIELFSVEKPPEFFLKKIAPKNAEESPLITIDGSGSDGALSASNAFYSQLLEELSKGEEVDFSAFKPREAKVYLENKRKHFERVIAKHPSDWYTDVTKDSYSMIHQLAKEVMDEKYMTGFVSEKDYLDSPWRSEVMNHHEIFSKHELERADKFSWMQDTQSKITLPDDKSVWHYWPFVANTSPLYVCNCDISVKCTRYNGKYGPVVWGTKHLHELKSYWNNVKVGSQPVTKHEQEVIEMMSPNEGKIDSVQSYDSELITAGAMQKTIKITGKGELTDQIVDFKKNNYEAYVELFENKGWFFSENSTYFQHEGFSNGEKLQGRKLIQKLREMCNQISFEKKETIDCLPIKNMACSMRDERFISKQLEDFVKRLRFVESIYLPKYKMKISEIFRSKLGLAAALDQHINRPSYVATDISNAINKFFSENSNISQDIKSWNSKDHDERERMILDIYGVDRRMTHPQLRYNKLLGKNSL